MALVTVGLLAFPPFLGSLVLGLFARTCRRVQLLRKGLTGTLGFSLEQFRLVNRNFSDAVIISVVLVFAVSFSVCDSRRLQFSWKWQYYLVRFQLSWSFSQLVLQMQTNFMLKLVMLVLDNYGLCLTLLVERWIAKFGVESYFESRFFCSCESACITCTFTTL